MNKEFKVDKLGFYRTENEKIAIVILKDEDIHLGVVKDSKYPWQAWDYNGKELLSSSYYYKYNLIEFIAPFDVWKMAKILTLAKDQQDIPPEFEKLFHENFWDLLA